MKIVPIKQIYALAPHRPHGYLDDMLNSGTRSGEAMQYENATYHALVRRYRPTLLQMGINLAKAGAGWAAQGFPLASQEVYDFRRAACAECPHYSADEVFHRCSICGCAKLKLHLATSECPDNPPRWRAVSACISASDNTH